VPPGLGSHRGSTASAAGNAVPVWVDHDAAVPLHSGRGSAPSVRVDVDAAATSGLNSGGGAPSVRVNHDPAVHEPGPERRQTGPPPTRLRRGTGGVRRYNRAGQSHRENERCHDTSSSCPHLHPPEPRNTEVGIDRSVRGVAKRRLQVCPRSRHLRHAELRIQQRRISCVALEVLAERNLVAPGRVWQPLLERGRFDATGGSIRPRNRQRLAENLQI